MIVLDVPVIDAVTVSVAAMDWLPAVFRVAGNVPVPLVRWNSQQGSRAIAAGEVDRSGISGGDEVARIERRDDEVERRSSGLRRRRRYREVSGQSRIDDDRARSARDRASHRVGGGDDLIAGGQQCKREGSHAADQVEFAGRNRRAVAC